jgi:tetratricopeptide (TPR) repeat protein
VRVLAVLVVAAACGVHTPAPIDVTDLVARRGPVEAHRDLEIQILAEPKDVAARLALAELDGFLGRPGEAIDELLFVERLGGPLGPLWHAADRARLAGLLEKRGHVRLAREAASALADFDHARSLGAQVRTHDATLARIAIAMAKLRHVDAGERARGRAMLGDLASEREAQPSWAGVRAQAAPEARGRFGAWAWAIGARREGYEQLAVWHAATSRPRDPLLEAAYLRALAWWSPPETEPPDETTDAVRCWFAKAGCAPPIEPSHAAAESPAGADPHAWAASHTALERVHQTAGGDELYKIALAFARDPAVAERLGRDLVARSVDNAGASAALGALYDALGDPARARASWQAAVDASPEPLFLRGLAEAAARTGDGPAALVFATTAAAAWGDPAVVWLSVARVLEDRGLHVQALLAAHSALDLADIETLAGALDVAASASRALGRDAQADVFAAQRARLP